MTRAKRKIDNTWLVRRKSISRILELFQREREKRKEDSAVMTDEDIKKKIKQTQHNYGFQAPKRGTSSARHVLGWEGKIDMRTTVNKSQNIG